VNVRAIAQAIAQKDLDLLVCPVCRQTLQLEPDAIRCTGCARRYPILDGIPVLLANHTL
jgi:uncharacterized protein YbaR (Trm112 family)